MSRLPIRLLRGLFVLALVVVFWLALQPAPALIKLVSWQDKIEHAVLFAGFMVWGMLAWPERIFAVAGGLLVYGLAMEVAQSFTSYRVGDPWDWLADAVGVAVVVLPAAWWRQRRTGPARIGAVR